MNSISLLLDIGRQAFRSGLKRVSNSPRAQRFIVDEETKRDYKHVYTPEIAKLDLYKICTSALQGFNVRANPK